MKKLVIFGTGKIAECVTYYFEREKKFQIVAYCCNREFIKEQTFNNRPVIAFEDISEAYPAEKYYLFVAVGYHRVNGLRSEIYRQGIDKGYEFATFVSPNVKGDFTVGENSLILDDVAIQPRVKIGNNVFIWGGALIGHHVHIEDNCWITGSANIGGLSIIGEGCFLGLNATVGHQVHIGKGSLIGANTLLTKSVEANSVAVVSDTEIHRLQTNQFLKLTSHF